MYSYNKVESCPLPVKTNKIYTFSFQLKIETSFNNFTVFLTIEYSLNKCCMAQCLIDFIASFYFKIKITGTNK